MPCNLAVSNKLDLNENSCVSFGAGLFIIILCLYFNSLRVPKVSLRAILIPYNNNSSFPCQYFFKLHFSKNQTHSWDYICSLTSFKENNICKKSPNLWRWLDCLDSFLEIIEGQWKQPFNLSNPLSNQNVSTHISKLFHALKMPLKVFPPLQEYLELF
jgi:hypothetical protein